MLGRALAAERGHEPLRLEAKPSFANLLVWKVIYEHGGRYYVDAVHVGPEQRTFPGESAEKLDLAKHLTWLDLDSVQARDIERFRWFSDDYLGIDAERPNHVIDVRYSVVPNEVQPLWGVRLDPAAPADAHVDYVTNRNASAEQGRLLLDMIFR